MATRAKAGEIFVGFGANGEVITKAVTEIEARVRQFEGQVKRVQNSIGGQADIAQHRMKVLEQAVQNLGGASKLTDAQLANVVKRVESLSAAGAQLPAAFKGLVEGARDAAEAQRLLAAYNDEVDRTTASLRKMETAARDMSILERAVARSGGLDTFRGADRAALAARVRSLRSEGAAVPDAFRVGLGVSGSAVAERDLERYRAQVEALKRSLSGRDARQEMGVLVTVVRELGGVSRLSGPAVEQLRERIRSLTAAGAEAPEHLRALVKETGDTGDALRNNLSDVGQDALQDLANHAGAAGPVLARLGPYGLVAAAGLGAMALAGGAVVTTLVAATREAIDYAGATADAAAANSVSAQSFQEMEFAGSRAGLGAAEIAKSVRAMQKALVESPDEFKYIGLAVEDLLAMEPADAFREVAARVAEIEDPAERTAAALRLLGREGDSIAAVGAAFSDARTRAHELGVVLSNEQIGKLDELGDAAGDLERTWRGMWINIGASIADAPGMTDAVVGLATAVGGLSRELRESTSFALFTDGVTKGIELLGGLAVAIDDVVGAIDRLRRSQRDEYGSLHPIAGRVQQYAYAASPLLGEAVRRFQAPEENDATRYFKEQFDRERMLDMLPPQARALFSGGGGGETEASGLFDPSFQRRMSEQLEAARKRAAAEAAAAAKRLAEMQAERERGFAILLDLTRRDDDVFVSVLHAYADGLSVQMAEVTVDAIRKSRVLILDKLNREFLHDASMRAIGMAPDQLEAQANPVATPLPAGFMDQLRARVDGPRQAQRAQNIITLEREALEGDAGALRALQALAETDEAAKRALDRVTAAIERADAASQRWAGNLMLVADALAGLEGAAPRMLGAGLQGAAGVIGGLRDGSKLKLDQKLFGAAAAGIGIIAAGRQTRDVGERTIGGLAQGAAAGSAFGPWGAVVGGALGGLGAALFGPKWAGAAKAAARVFGDAVSDELAKAIKASADKYGLNSHMASYLHISDQIQESGADPREYSAQIQDLLNATANGAVPAAAGIAELGRSFTLVRDAAERAGVAGDRALFDIVRRARELNLDVPEIAEHIKTRASAAVENLGFLAQSSSSYRIIRDRDGNPLVQHDRAGNELRDEDGELIYRRERVVEQAGGIALTSQQSADDQATIVQLNFEFARAQLGIVAAADAMREQVAGLRDTADGLGFELNLGSLEQFLELTKEGSAFRGVAQGSDALSRNLGALTEAALPMAEAQFDAFERQAVDAFEQAKAAALDSGLGIEQANAAAFEASKALVQQLITTAGDYNFTLDEGTRALIAQGEAMGYAFPTDATDALRESIDALTTALGGVPPRIHDITRAMDGMGNRSVTIPVNFGADGPPRDHDAPAGTPGEPHFIPSQFNGGAFTAAEGLGPVRLTGDTLIHAHANELAVIIPEAKARGMRFVSAALGLYQVGSGGNDSGLGDVSMAEAPLGLGVDEAGPGLAELVEALAGAQAVTVQVASPTTHIQHGFMTAADHREYMRIFERDLARATSRGTGPMAEAIVAHLRRAGVRIGAR